MKAAIYCRVSSTEQCRRGTIESQRASLLARAHASGYEVVGIYEDDGMTAKAGHLEARDGLRRLLLDAEARRFAVLLVVDVDRLTRSDDLIERYGILGTFQRAGMGVLP